MAASVSTLVVSWNDEAEMNDSVDSDALVMPRSSGSRLAGAHPIALADAEVLALRDQVLLGLADFRRDHHLALALGVLAERHDAVDLGDDRVLLRLARLEQLGDARKAARDVLGLGGLARDLGDDVARL